SPPPSSPPPRSTLFPYTTLFRSGHDDILPLFKIIHFRQVLGNCPACNSHAAAVDVSFPVKHFHDTLYTAYLIQILHYIASARLRSEEHTSELQSRFDLVCRLLLE